METGAFSPIHLSWLDALARIGAATLLAFSLGLERFLRKKPIDFRPFVIISLASCALVIAIAEFAARAGNSELDVDPTRAVQGVMTGIGFIGAGALFREQHTVYGAGSAASIWAAGAIGLTCGFGLLWLAALLTLGLILVLVLSQPFTADYTIRMDDEEDSESRGGG